MSVIAKATRKLTEHVRDMTEKTKSAGCCVGKPVNIKENMKLTNNNQHLNGTVVHYIYNHNTKTTYTKGKLLGKGGFARCYELTDMRTGKTYAGKIISKSRIAKPHQKEKIAREVELHKNLKHKNVVEFHSYFEDEENVYIILENCSRKSLVHVLKSRKTLTEPEVRFYFRQLVEASRYIHSQKIVHRDLKLGNMLLNETMQLKVSDFGLATQVQYEGEKKMTVCGTPNYIAPEVLQKKGHSFEADLWAMGCIMYAMLVGRPPFETATLKETYMRITANQYTIPSYVSPHARSLIQRLLSADPQKRPTLDVMLQDDFFRHGYTPKLLSAACCDVAPKFPSSSSRPKSYAASVSPTEALHKVSSSISQLKGTRRLESTPVPAHGSMPTLSHKGSLPELDKRPLSPIKQTPGSAPAPEQTPNPVVEEKPPDMPDSSTVNSNDTTSAKQRPTSAEIKALPFGSAIRLQLMLTHCLEHMPADSSPSAVENVKPLWVTKWVDYSNKYGFGFQLSDRSVGVLFNDRTRMMLGADGKTILYSDLSRKMYSFAVDTVPSDFQKKATLLLYFTQYMDDHLIHGGNMQTPRSDAAPATGISVKTWFRTVRAIVMYLTNGTFQVNFFEDHTKVILCPDGQDYLVTYINSGRQAATYRLLQLRHFGCSPEIKERLGYALNMLQTVIDFEGEAV